MTVRFVLLLSILHGPQHRYVNLSLRHYLCTLIYSATLDGYMKFNPTMDRDRSAFKEAECRGCGTRQAIDDLGLCGGCSAKLDRDMIRKRDWEFSMSAFGVARDKRDTLRLEIIEKYGKELELLAEDDSPKGNAKSHKKKRRKKKKLRKD